MKCNKGLNGEIILGVSNAPAQKELAYAEKGCGTYVNDKKVEVSQIGSLSESYVSFGGVERFEKHNNLKQLLSLINSTQGHRGFGDAWSYHLLIKGKIDIVVEAELKVWDIAALKIIVEEAGGKVTDINGKPIDKDSTSAIATNNLLHKNVLKILKE